MPLIIPNRTVLDRSRSKSDGNKGNEAKFGRSEDIHFTVAITGTSAASSIDCKEHEGDVVRRKPKMTEMKMREYHLEDLEKKYSSLHRKMIRNTNTVEDVLHSYKNVDAVRAQLWQVDVIFKMILDVQKSFNSLLLSSKQESDEKWLANLEQKSAHLNRKCIAG